MPLGVRRSSLAGSLFKTINQLFSASKARFTFFWHING